MRYQTEIHISADRYVCLQLPTYFPEGRAVVTVTIEGEGSVSSAQSAIEEVDHQDIEWWDEFDDDEIGPSV
jgi:predicted HD phosphohydrolase